MQGHVYIQEPLSFHSRNNGLCTGTYRAFASRHVPQQGLPIKNLRRHLAGMPGLGRKVHDEQVS